MAEWIWTGQGWQYDTQAPEADNSATSMLPVYAAANAEPVITADPATGPIPQVAFQAAPSFTQADGSTYERVDPAHFPIFDEFDSTQVIDDGAPH